jgi:hypothetical protein
VRPRASPVAFSLNRQAAAAAAEGNNFFFKEKVKNCAEYYANYVNWIIPWIRHL